MLTCEDYRKWLMTCLSAGIPAISMDTCARIMAVLLEYGNNEGFTFNQKFLAEKEYIQQRFHIHEMEVPDVEFATLLKGYVKELQDFYTQHRQETSEMKMVPLWAPRLLKERYNLKFIL